jgi:hypothetical protein
MATAHCQQKSDSIGFNQWRLRHQFQQTPGLSVDPRARLLTFHGTVVFVDTTSGELRHGPVTASPSNVVLVRDGEQVRIKFVGPGGQQDIVCLPDYSAVVGSPKAGTNDTAITPTVFSCVGAASEDFGLTAHGKFLSAERDGRLTLSRPHCRAWEKFQVQEDAGVATDSGRFIAGGASRSHGRTSRLPPNYLINLDRSVVRLKPSETAIHICLM